jgi:hypothetical protein
MLRFTRISRLTDERSRCQHPEPFVIASLGSRNNIQFGRIGDMVCSPPSHDCWISVIPAGRLTRRFYCVLLSPFFASSVDSVCTIVEWETYDITFQFYTRRPVLTAYRVLGPSKSANATLTKTRQRGPRVRPSLTKRRRASSARSVGSPL